MDIIKIDPNRPDKKIIKEAVNVLKKGGVVMYPTDTAYGLAADIKSRKGIKKIFRIKERIKNKTLPLIVGSIKIANEYVLWTPTGKQLAKKYWPGPLTLVLKSKLRNQSIVKKEKIAIRVPDNKIAQMISEKLARPVTSTSANVSGKKECYSVAEFLNQKVKALPDLILDAGKLPKKKLSTIVDISIETPIIIRSGAINVRVF